MAFPSPIGYSDFLQLRKAGAYYVDKTELLEHLLVRHSQVVLFPRPRRFGKTLMQSVLRYFFEIRDEDLSWMYQDLQVWQCQECRKHFQKHPVIDLSFKGVKRDTFEGLIEGVRGVVGEEFRRHMYLLDSHELRADEKRFFETVLDRTVSVARLQESMALLCRWLDHHHHAMPVILLDEYDVPIQAAFRGGFYDQAMDGFFRDFITYAFKDNRHLFRGVLTGILRVSKESMFSGANNVDVYSILSKTYSTCFGFTQQEVDEIMAQVGDPDAITVAREWYNGYQFAGHTIYNPWSVLNYAAKVHNGPKAYWTFTGSNDVLRTLVLGQAEEVTEDIKTLMHGGALQRIVTDYMVMNDLQNDPDAVMNLLLLSGYLTMRTCKLIDGRYHAQLVIPNKEVHVMFEENIIHWTEEMAPDGRRGLRLLYRAMFAGAEEEFEELLSAMVVNTLSYHDMRDDSPEAVFQAFILGAMLSLRDEYMVKSNRESGYGRYDLALIPKKPGKPGVIFEFKRLRKRRNETPQQALDAAQAQMLKLDYDADQREAGADPVVKWAVAFQGKQLWLRLVDGG